ncbi:cytochrome c [Serratia sp. M24T3]|uniref:c-type cytochrome n=1 Tax=Serratia sp. M24T3 TaxID=932213 RepID=UPI00025BBEFB|nr:cytochrome c [Serratia sp. M24T3]EIC83077.1 cytochrome c class I [Serratia sp. M24T3]
MHFLTRSALGVCLAWISISAMAEGNIANGQAKSASCAACHGATGKASNTLYPNLSGQNEAYLGLALHAYKDGGRTGGQAGIMQAFTSGLSDQDISDLAAYYSSQH